MKKILMVLMLVITASAISQTYVDPSLCKYVDEYILEAKKRGCEEVESRIRGMNYIGYSMLLEFPVLGYCTPDQQNVLISPYCTLEEFILKAVLFHELTHACFGGGHCDCYGEIMDAGSPSSYYPFSDEEYWQERLDFLFNNV